MSGLALMLVAKTGSKCRENLELAGNKLPEDGRLLEINGVNFFLATNTLHK